MKTVIYIEKEKFLRDLMEKALVSAGLQIYSYPDDDCMHFIKDLQPDVLIVDTETVDQEFIKLIDTQIPVILTGTSESLALIKTPVRLQIEKPLGPFDLVAQVLSLLS